MTQHRSNDVAAATAPDVEEAYACCEAITRAHYENFPVGSVLVPKALRRHFYSVYAYSRGADDIADEGMRSVQERLALLDEWERHLEEAIDGTATHPVFVALGATITDRGLPARPLRDLLTAFRLDARNQGYATYEDLLGYCRCSANPVGRLVLAIFGLLTPERAALSDEICTALQLANFWQDISVDLPRDRVNVPREVMERFGCTADDLRAGRLSPAVRAMLEYLVADARMRFARGRALLRMIPVRRLRWELGAVTVGGERILGKIQASGYDVFRHRPSLGVADKVAMLWGAFR
ncbi:MAG TPA: squalene synthase HpnC [Candidatus Kapabacteria bacterium]|nr:squalene synthase HpnC [Candidatus Kapabacteria bacterium]